MKHKYLLVLKIVLIVLIVEVVLSGMYYLFVYDANKPRQYEPQLSSRFLEMQIEKIEPLTEDYIDEVMISQDDFKGILGYYCYKDASDEMDGFVGYLEYCGGSYTHIVFPDDSYEICVGTVIYENIIDAWQYGWWDRDGNRYADINGEDAAKGKPNYRYHYRFVVRNNNDIYSMEAFCNTDDAEKVFSVCVENMNNVE
ncbi:MAG: hypothetical protein J6B96_01690 [Agathobacter sp.]|nr:hypothetical protein [Agathobacter sp.]